MKKNIFKMLIASVAAVVCVVVCGVTGNTNMAAKADIGDVYTQNFTSVSEVNNDFTAYYQTAMGASNVMMEVASDENGYGNWYLKDGALIRKPMDEDISSSFGTESFATLTLTKRTYVNFELTVDYKRDGGTYYWPVVAFRQSEPGQYFLEDGLGVFVQRDGKTTMWGGEGVGGPYESSSRGGYVDGEWHTLKIRVEGISVNVYVDGEATPSLSRALPTNMFRQGYITLTSVNNACAFRNLSIKELAVTAIGGNESQDPMDEADTDDALGNLAENVDKIDELEGLTQKSDGQSQTTVTPPVANEEKDGCGSVLSLSCGGLVLLLGGVILLKKRGQK